MRPTVTTQVNMPAKITLDTGEGNDWPPYGGSYNAMPAYIGEDVDISGIKWVWGFNDNYKKGIPYIGGVIILNEARTGEIPGHHGRQLYHGYQNRRVSRRSRQIPGPQGCQGGRNYRQQAFREE